MNPDVLRIMLELYTFTVSDLADALEMTEQGAGKIINHGIELKLLVRFRMRGGYVIALSERGERAARKLPAIDPDEMCLPLSFEGITPCDCMHYEPPIVISKIVGLINNGATRIIEDNQYCRSCGVWLCSARYTETPF